MDIVCRASSRLLVDLPLCRDPDWMDLNKRFTLEVKASSSFRSTVAPLLRDEAQHGKDWPGRLNDVISWTFGVAAKKYPVVMVKAILMMIFVAIHTTTMMLTSTEGWSKSSVRELWKLDGFIEESFRLGLLLLMNRKAPYRYDPQSFDGFRFEKARSQEGEEHKHRHPGRFFVINEVKVLLARVLLRWRMDPKSGNLELSLAQTCPVPQAGSLIL
ncbi:hypothetical protein M378DRAFT_14724 [Amanita muscaria Koide BX008]|uniref:Uncharacterized protein n=1 Tax=Amanita muscaria (strain Koide BX008) TaxID=946122 RepID=A0A0C2S9Z2_AMAMK|nr:hypothetical protein M378DRAFT_14724 [Amanita muscaria Koide BX008]